MGAPTYGETQVLPLAEINYDWSDSCGVQQPRMYSFCLISIIPFHQAPSQSSRLHLNQYSTSPYTTKYITLDAPFGSTFLDSMIDAVVSYVAPCLIIHDARLRFDFYVSTPKEEILSFQTDDTELLEKRPNCGPADIGESLSPLALCVPCCNNRHFLC